jgi:hypothetical protein
MPNCLNAANHVHVTTTIDTEIVSNALLQAYLSFSSININIYWQALFAIRC